MKELKAYFWKCDRDAECGIAVIAYDSKQAKQLGYAYWGSDVGHEAPDSFIEQRCSLIKGKIDLKGINEPTVISSDVDGLRRGLYGWVEANCELCNIDRTLTTVHNGKAICSSCEDGLTENNKKEED